MPDLSKTLSFAQVFAQSINVKTSQAVITKLCYVSIHGRCFQSKIFTRLYSVALSVMLTTFQNYVR